MHLYHEFEASANLQILAEQFLDFADRNTPQKSTRSILQFMIDMMNISYSLSLMNCYNFSAAIDLISLGYDPLDLNTKEFTKYDKFVVKLCQHKESTCPTWLEKTALFLLEMHTKENLQAPAARLSLPFLKSLNMMRLKLKREDNQNEEEIEWLYEQCYTFYLIVNHGLRYSNVSQKIVETLCLLHEQSSDLYIRNNQTLSFYVRCLETDNYMITNRGLKSIKTILVNPNFSTEDKTVLVKYLVKEEHRFLLWNLCHIQIIRIMESCIEVISLIHEFIPRISGWDQSHYDDLYHNIYHDNVRIRKIAARLFLKVHSAGCPHDGVILIEMLEFYFITNGNTEYLSRYIDAFWEFEYMKNLENIFALYGNYQAHIRSALISHFTYALFKRMLNDFTDNFTRIQNLIKKLPKILTELEDDPLSYDIILNILCEVDTNLYSDTQLKSDKYRKRLIKALETMFTKNQDNYVLLSNIFFVIHRFSEVYSEAKETITNLINTSYMKFLEIFYSWKNMNFLADSSAAKDVQECVNKMSIIACRKGYLDTAQEDILLGFLETTLITYNHFLAFRECKIEAIAITLLSDLFQRRLAAILRLEEELFSQIGSIKTKIEKFIELLSAVLTRKEKSLFLGKQAFEALVNLLCCTQERLRYSEYPEIRELLVPVTLDLYYLMIEFVIEIIAHPEEESKPFTLHAKKRILEKFALLHEKHIGLPLSSYVGKVIVHYTLVKEFHDEFVLLIKALLRYETPKEKPFTRFTQVFSAILYYLGQFDISGDKIETAIKSYGKIFSENLKANDKELVISASILNLFEHLKSNLRSTDSNRNYNRLKILKFLRSLLTADEGRHTNVIKQQLRQLQIGLTSEEMTTLRNFEKTVA